MPSRRAQKAAEAIREVVGMAIIAELKDPRIRDVTVTRVEVSSDLRHAKVHVSVMGDETKQNLSLRGLQSAAGFLQTQCAKRINTRYTPKIDFYLDEGVKKSIEIARILREVLAESETSGAEPDRADEIDGDEIDGDEIGDEIEDEIEDEEEEEDAGDFRSDADPEDPPERQ